ncbi:MAG: hypothetical protein A3G18_03810 [Rhodospirillales bacterium RIFCSPLOWO2_12_FULL_58_28]|nr:MAG: hypothetical protein A3H92_01750 [Rhodospirillales bacterium RIFCSPLOWO2_02_FULL_58_16]OHC78102.1 MAG: hypothetical protein A3G18_03810 [Rhodospirillales bacterium RIFCSPLOWO2_12_FULL_58_28]
MAGVEAAVAKTGMVCLGALHPGAGDGAPKSAGTLVLVGNAGPDMWNAFSAERQEGADPLDAWTRRKLDGVCRELGANDVLYASGKPHHPFVKWAQRAGIAHPSLIGLNIHPEYGLWHAYRGALVFEEKLDMPPAGPTKNPCSSCKDKPCLSACSAGAFDGGKYDASACAGLLQKPAGVNCMSNGCAARHACHVGKEYTYDKAQSAFHMRAFAASQPTA